MAAAAAHAGKLFRPVRTAQLEIRCDRAKGRGIFARTPIEVGALLERAPVILVPAAERSALDQTIVHDYYFQWGVTGMAAVALGLVSLCNHSRRPRARVRRNDEDATLDLIARLPIAAGEEVTIDYNCRLWFHPQD